MKIIHSNRGKSSSSFFDHYKEFPAQKKLISNLGDDEEDAISRVSNAQVTIKPNLTKICRCCGLSVYTR